MLWLRADNLSKTYGRTKIFSALSFSVEQGAVLSVAGPNGSGKSTLLRVAAGLLRPTRGTLECGEKAGAPWERDLRRAATGYLSPELSLYEPLTARENLEFFSRVRGTPARADGLLELVGLEGRGDDPVAAFSSGMKQRLKLAFAVQAEPRLLLLDEPGVTLDDAGRAVLRRVLEQQRHRGLALLASNEPEEVALGDDVLRLGG